ncbi:MAG: polysulfide reductase NrfD [Clostridiales bacterium]|nr:polysulfide reductase NrfD [Clostridiales bacterium]
MSTLDWIIFIVAAIVFVITGLSILYNMAKGGHHKTNLTDKFVWGINTQIFYALSSFGTGLMVVMSAIILLVGTEFLYSILQAGNSIAFACVLSGVIQMGIDLGKPQRAMKVLFGKKFNSPLTIDFIALTVLMILSIIFIVGMGSASLAALKIWAYLTTLISVLCMSTHTLLIASRFEPGFRSNPFHSAETFVCSIWSGLAIMTLLSLGNPLTEVFVKMLLVFSAASLIKGISSVIALNLGKSEIHTHKKAFILLSAITFIILVIGDLAAIRQGGLVIVACLLTLAAVIVEKGASVIVVQKRPVIPAPYNKFDPKERYVPSKTEIGYLLFSIALIAVIPYGVFLIGFGA